MSPQSLLSMQLLWHVAFYITCVLLERLLSSMNGFLARKDIHTLDNSEEDDVDVVERNLAGASDAKEIRKALTSLFESQM